MQQSQDNIHSSVSFQKVALIITINEYKVHQFSTLADAEVKSEEELVLELLTAAKIRIYFNHNFNCISIGKSVK